MIKFTVDGEGGRTLVGLGMSEGNVERLKAGMPIFVNLAALGLPPIDIYIFYGETEHDLADMVKPNLGPESKVTLDPRLGIDILQPSNKKRRPS